MSWMILFKKQLFDLDVKGQGSTKKCQFIRYSWFEKLYSQQKSRCDIWRIRVMVFNATFNNISVISWRSVLYPHTKYHWPISKDKNVMARTRKYYLKNNYLTLRSKVKVPQRSLRYATHHLMVMHIRTICQWTVLLDLFELCRIP
jgi:hypothetical protein